MLGPSTFNASLDITRAAENGTIEYINWVYNATEVDIFNMNNPSEDIPANLNNNDTLAEDDPNRGRTRYVALRVGGYKTHVGTLRKQRLWDAVAACIQWTVRPIKPGASPDHCQNGDGKCEKSCTIKNIVRNDGHDNRYSSLGTLTVYVDWSEFTEKSHPGLRNGVVSDNEPIKLYINTHSLQIKLAAEMFASQADLAENCYVTPFRMSRVTKMCNILSHALIVVDPERKQSPEAVLAVRVEYNDSGHVPVDSKGNPDVNGRPDGGDQAGTVSCANANEQVSKMFREHQRATIAGSLGLREDNMYPVPYCLQNDNNKRCVTTPAGRRVGQDPWVEQSSCDLKKGQS